MKKDDVAPEIKGELVKNLKAEIDKRVLIKIQWLEKSHHNAKIDPKKIEKECIQELVLGMEPQFENNSKILINFKERLKEDHPDLYKQLIEWQAKQAAGDRIEDLLKSQKSGEMTLEDIATLLGIDNDPSSKVFTDQDLDILFNIAKNWFSKNEYSRAYDYLVSLTILSAQSSEVWLMRGIIEQHLGKFDNAIESYFKAILYDPNDIKIFINLMNCLILANKLEQAKAVYDKFKLEIDPSMYSHDEQIAKGLESIRKFVTGEMIIK